jgi:NAD(P)-dependent dehydrogenase (short-subunit alcohol dehydrogenase family)
MRLDPRSAATDDRAASAGLAGRVAIVTGGGRGIGAATAALLAGDGARVVIGSRTVEELEATARTISAAAGAGRVLAVPTDVADEAAVVRLFDEALARFGDLDLVVNNAGAFAGGAFADLDAATFDRVQAVNVRGVFLASREAFRRFRALGHGGAIVNVSSLGGIQGTEKFAGFAAYTASKFAVVGLTESLAVEGRTLGIRVNCVAPGAVDTRMMREAAPFLRTATTPADVARTIRFLCDERESGTLNGAVLEIHSNL